MHIWNDITVIFACISMYFNAIYDQRYNQIWLDMKLIFACICLYLTVFSLASTQQCVLMRRMGSGLNQLPQPQPQPQPEPEQELEACRPTGGLAGQAQLQPQPEPEPEQELEAWQEGWARRSERSAIGYTISYCGHSGVIVVCSSIWCLSACKQTK